VRIGLFIPSLPGGRLRQVELKSAIMPAEYVVAADSSCPMHQQGCAESIGVRTIHFAQILNGAAE
jgi:hypothetical protein